MIFPSNCQLLNNQHVISGRIKRHTLYIFLGLEEELLKSQYKMIEQVDIQWNPVNTDTNGTCPSVRINGVSVLSGLSEKKLQTHVLSKKRP